MNLYQLHYFRKLAELQHYTRAAKELFISQPTLSDAISSLEKELDVPLFQKQGRNIILTKYGEMFYEYVDKALGILDEGTIKVKNLKGELGGIINLGTTFTIQDDYLPELINNYRRVHGPKIHINTHQGFSNYLIESLRDETLDVAFCGMRDDVPNIEYHPITSRELVLAVQSEHPLSTKKSIDLSEVRDYHLLTYRRGTPIGAQMTELIEKYDLQNTIQLYDDDITMASLISFDGSVGALIIKSIGLKLFSDLCIIPVEGVRKDFYRIYLAYNKIHFQTNAAKSFIAFVQNYEGNDFELLEN